MNSEVEKNNKSVVTFFATSKMFARLVLAAAAVILVIAVVTFIPSMGTSYDLDECEAFTAEHGCPAEEYVVQLTNQINEVDLMIEALSIELAEKPPEDKEMIDDKVEWACDRITHALAGSERSNYSNPFNILNEDALPRADHKHAVPVHNWTELDYEDTWGPIEEYELAWYWQEWETNKICGYVFARYNIVTDTWSNISYVPIEEVSPAFDVAVWNRMTAMRNREEG